MGYKKVPDGFSFSTEFDTYILAYCSADCTWFATNKRFFYFEYDKEFKTEEDAVAYFENNLKEFYDIELKICDYRPDFLKNKIRLLRTKPVGKELLSYTEYDMKLTLHGYWRDCSNGWICSVCNRDNRYDKDICPHCGAIMDLKYKKEEEAK